MTKKQRHLWFWFFLPLGILIVLLVVFYFLTEGAAWEPFRYQVF